MKRWQARGEVPDSDDEEPDLEAEIESESPVRKKARISRASREDGVVGPKEAPDQSIAGEAELGEAWLRPRVANTYGKRSRPATAEGRWNSIREPARGANNDPEAIIETSPTLDASINNSTAATPIAEGDDDSAPYETLDEPREDPVPIPASDDDGKPQSIIEPARDGSDDVDTTVRIRPTLDASLNDDTTAPNFAADHEGSAPFEALDDEPNDQPISSQASNGLTSLQRSQIAAVETEEPAGLATQDTDSESLPDPTNVVRRNGADGVRRQSGGKDVPSGCSSPLSERSISPPAPEGILRRPQDGRVAHAGSTPAAEGTDDVRLDVNESTGSAGLVEAMQAGRRTFRARNAQQLHPYQYENIQYERQLKARGLKPVRVVEAQRRAAKAHAEHSSGEEQESWHSSQQASSSPAKASSGPQDITNAFGRGDSEDELPDLAPPGRRLAGVVIQRGQKRQKLSHPHAPPRRIVANDSLPRDEFSIPPSPPPTSSESNNTRQSSPRAAVFRYPRGMTPARHTQQPTPNVSSELRNIGLESDEDIPRRPGASASSRPRHTPVPIDSSSESSASEAEGENDNADMRRLVREKKRTKGVLPASWLKLDFNAQQRRGSPSPTKRRDHATESPEKAMPQKGVAHRVTSRLSGQATQRAPVPISDSESDGNSRNRSPPAKRQSRLQIDRAASSTAPVDFADDDRMEVDYVDAMLAGSSRSRSRHASSKKRQPRITEAFNTGEGQGTGFAEERRVARRAGGASTGRDKNGKSGEHRQRARKPATPRLSIVDAPRQASSSPEALPQFVRLAVRKARTQNDGGRHSPTRKHIRLATDQDTEDATSILRAWREGTMARRVQPSTATIRPAPFATARNQRGETEAGDGQRLPLAEVSGNRQEHLAGALRTSAAKQQTGAKKVHLSKPRMRQSRREPVSLEDDRPTERTEPNLANQAVPTPSRNPDRRRRARPLPSQARYRGAQVESLEAEFDYGHRAAAFERRMQILTETAVRGSRRTPAAPVQLERFLYGPEVIPSDSGAQRVPQPRIQSGSHGRCDSGGADQQAQEDDPRDCQTPTRPQTHVHRPRKRLPHRIDVETRQYRQPSEPLPEVIDLDHEPQTVQTNIGDGPILQGLGPFSTRYPADFDILPLPLGTYFHQSSFVGSGDFAASLNFAARDLDVATGRIRVHVDTEVLDLGIWNEEVAVALAKIPDAVGNALESLWKDAELQSSQDSPDLILANVDYLLRSTVRYFTRCLAFSDPIDRQACIQSLHRLVEDTLEAAVEPALTESTHKDIRTRCLQYAAVLARQALGLSSHSMVPQDLAASSESLCQKATSRFASQFVHAHLGSLKAFYEELRHATKREAGIRDTDSAICSITTLRHLLKDAGPTASSFWSTLYNAMNVDVGSLSSVSGLDKVWRDVFTVLPALEIDSRGILQLDSRFSDGKEDWSLVKALLERLFQLYPATSLLPGSTINDYVRATLTRCSTLLSRWGWYRCEPTLNSISDFFARRGLAQLHKEESHKSPDFLENLNQSPSLEVHADDRSFHIFLKMLATGLQSMHDRQIYPDRKIGGIAWRFIPNHGRTHRKDADLRQEDLAALRNHHDMLSTIYYASPPSNRIRVDLIQNLVDHSASHREPCRLNVRAWRNLAAFQASTSEPIERLGPFNVWFQELLSANIMQFRLARTEVEQDVTAAVREGKPAVSQDTIESVVAANQRQIAATITDALAAVKHALQTASSATVASSIIKGTEFWQAFELFDPASRRVFGMFEEDLDVIKTALGVQRKFILEDESQQGSDDSQDYGDSSALQELASTHAPAANLGNDILQTVSAPLAHFVSNVFGADGMSDNGLLTKVVDVWVKCASQMVSQGTKSWSSYISAYSSEAWSQLRDTEQRRKYTPYFLARVVDLSDIDLTEAGILPFWLTSLVERESRLKFQHVLTNALLNRRRDVPLLANLPFVRTRHGPFAISLHELRRSRLGLISSILSNMHQHFDNTLTLRPRDLPELRRTYGDMLHQMMQAMRLNYQEVQSSSGGAVADAGAQGEYVGFVHQVVSCLQQYTADICPVDRFFTDSSAFPLPAADPSYVVGKLKGYVSKLAESRKRKELAVFIQTVSERAAVDGHQGYLVDQLVAAMTGVLERGCPRTPSLRHVLMTAVFPAYVENALSTACSWILALPIIKTCGLTMEDLLYSVKFEEEGSLEAALETMELPLQSMLRPIETALAYPGQMMFPHVLAALTAIYDTVRHGLSAMQHVARAGRNDHVAQLTCQFNRYAHAIESLLIGEEEPDFLDSPLDKPASSTRWIDTNEFVRRQIQDKKDGWHARDGQYFMRRGAGHVEVVMHLGDLEDEKQRLLAALRRFFGSYGVVFAGHASEEIVSGMEELVV